MSLLLLIDGYNVLAPVAAPNRDPDGRWLQRERMNLVRRLVDHLTDLQRENTCIVFDAATSPQGRPSNFSVAPRNLTVVSSDHRVQTVAKRRGCEFCDSQPWLDDLLDGKIALACKSSKQTGQGRGVEGTEKPNRVVNEEQVEAWMKEFGF